MVKASKKITMTVFLAVVLTVCLFAFSASAATEGPYTYEINNGEVTITHCDPDGISGDITIPKSLGGIRVTAIGERAFYYCNGINSVTIEDNIKSIAPQAFAMCGALSEVILPDSLVEIADGTFADCTNLAKVSLSKTQIKTIGANAFSGCEFIETITLPDTLETVDEGAFKGCWGLRTVIVGNNTKSIGKSAFANCYNLSDIYYAGEKEAFDKIAIAEGNESLKSAYAYYNHIHVYDDVEKIRDGDCVIKSRKIYTCRCSDYYNEFKYGAHSYKSVTTKATFKADGKTESKCKLCGNVKKTTVIPKVVAKLSKTDYTYTGKAITPTVSVKNSKGTALTKDKSYTLKYSSGRTEMGEYYVKVTLSGSKYSGSTKLYFNIVPGKAAVTAKTDTDSVTLTWNKVTGAKGYKVYSYNPQTKKYKALKTVSGTTYTIEKLDSATEYTYTVRAYAKAGSETIWGSHSAVTTATAPKSVKLSSVSSGNAGKAVLKWSKLPADGYEIYMAENGGKYKKIKTVTKNTTVTYTKASLKSGVKYSFKIRAYVSVDGAKVYGAYSNVKTVSIK
ncbi:MAG: fibronectin type III domain-containing protein [Clostridia bacterium]|nr:fibronectin type III domain-containing protein [Clostridia bacterium]